MDKKNTDDMENEISFFVADRWQDGQGKMDLRTGKNRRTGERRRGDRRVGDRRMVERRG